MTLTIDDFTRFWQEVHGATAPHQPPSREAEPPPNPFPWQLDLVREVATEGWPSTLDIPTGLGKTTALDIAVFTLALDLQDAATRTKPRRIFMVIDRRVVVDQSFDHAQRIREALTNAPEGSVTSRVAAALRPPSVRPTDADNEAGDDDERVPLVVGRMRGGVNWSWRWLDRPDQPAIIVGTVDQLGSRMLFGGYGVGQNLRPIDAALVGSDSLVLIDEAHLAEPLITTVQDAQRFGRGTDPINLPGSELVLMSATAPEASTTPFTIDVDAHLEHPVAEKRLQADKRLHLATAKITKKRRVGDTGKVLANLAQQLGKDHDVVGIVANTIAVARAAFEQLQAVEAIADDDVVLITGRQRPIDRTAVWDRWRERITAGRLPNDGPARYVVATQTIEVGADLDFSALVSESASVDALTQRLGRLNRRGDWSTSTAVIVHPDISDDDDPIYGPARAATWKWLTHTTDPVRVTPKTTTVDLNPPLPADPLSLRQRLDDLDPTQRSTLRMPRPVVPVLFPGILDRWVQTSPQPMDSPPPAPYLHGVDRAQPTVSVVWRQIHTSTTGRAADIVADLEDSVDILPTAAAETIEVPLWAVAKWLQEEPESADVADLEAVAGEPIPSSTNEGGTTALLLRDGDDPARLRGRLRPGDTIVVPTWVGGCDQYGWNPRSSHPVLDVADLAVHRIMARSDARWRQRRSVLRFDESTLKPLLDLLPDIPFDGTDEHAAPADLFAGLNDQQEDDDQQDGDGDEFEFGTDEANKRLEQLRTRLEPHDGVGLPGQLGDLVDRLLATGTGLRVSVLQPPDRQTGQAATSSRRQRGRRVILIHGPHAMDVWAEDSSSAGTSTTGSQVSLQDHHDAVRGRAACFAESMSLSSALQEVIQIAAAWHDHGKVDPRFQRMLNNGVAPAGDPLAKSGMDPSNRWAFRRAAELSGYPKGMRHENFSARAARALLADHPEADLISHLIASHHGRARPLEAAVVDQRPQRYEINANGSSVMIDTSEGVDWAQPSRFAALNRRFGPWGLALLETVVRLADIACSQEGT